MPRPKGSRNPERERSPNVRAVVEVLDAMTLAELLVARHAVTDRVAQHSEYEQNVALRSYRLEVRVLAAIEEADYEKRLSTGAPLRTVDDYREYKAPDAPGVPGTRPRVAVVRRNDLQCSPCIYRGHALGTPEGCPTRPCLTELGIVPVLAEARRLLAARTVGSAAPAD